MPQSNTSTTVMNATDTPTVKIPCIIKVQTSTTEVQNLTAIQSTSEVQNSTDIDHNSIRIGSPSNFSIPEILLTTEVQTTTEVPLTTTEIPNTTAHGKLKPYITKLIFNFYNIV